jgi:hypothetical protein
MDGEGRHKSKGFFEAVTEIQQTYVAEKSGLTIDENFLTIEQRLEFWMIGLKSMLGGGLIMMLTLPFSIAVIQEKLPVFSGNVTLFDKIYVLFLSFSFIVGIAYFFYYISRFNVGKMTRGMLMNMFSGLTIGVFIKTGLTVFLYALIRYKLLAESSLIHIFTFLINNKFFHISNEMANYLYQESLIYRDILIQSAYTVLISNAIMLIFLWFGYVKHLRENKKKATNWNNMN